jgi:hypothetical protein
MLPRPMQHKRRYLRGLSAWRGGADECGAAVMSEALRHSGGPTPRAVVLTRWNVDRRWRRADRAAPIRVHHDPHRPGRALPVRGRPSPEPAEAARDLWAASSNGQTWSTFSDPEAEPDINWGRRVNNDGHRGSAADANRQHLQVLNVICQDASSVHRSRTAASHTMARLSSCVHAVKARIEARIVRPPTIDGAPEALRNSGGRPCDRGAPLHALRPAGPRLNDLRRANLRRMWHSTCSKAGHAVCACVVSGTR